MSDINSKIESFVKKYLEKVLDRQIKNDPKMSTNPRMAEWFTLGFYVGAQAQGEAINAILAQPVEVDPVPEESNVNDISDMFYGCEKLESLKGSENLEESDENRTS